MPAKRYLVELTPDERQELTKLVSAGKRAARTLTRARILLKADQAQGGPGWDDGRIADALLRTIPGIGPVLGLTLLYEVDDIRRFPEPGHFLSYARLVRCEHSSAGKVKGSGPKKMGNAHLKWAFSEAACLMLRAVPAVKGWVQRQEKRKGKRKALAILEAKIGRAVYHLWRKQVPFDLRRFLKG